MKNANKVRFDDLPLNARFRRNVAWDADIYIKFYPLRIPSGPYWRERDEEDIYNVLNLQTHEVEEFVGDFDEVVTLLEVLK